MSLTPVQLLAAITPDAVSMHQPAAKSGPLSFAANTLRNDDRD